MRSELHNDTLTIFLEGRIDSNNAAETESEIMSVLLQNPAASNVQIDADGLSYISSAGLRVLLKVRKHLKTPLRVLNVSGEVYDIFSVTGFTELLDVHKKMREVSVDGCEVVGEGANGKVYRLTRDEMIKVYKYNVPLEAIEEEREASRKAFLLGVPCAIAFDTVKCGDSYGTVYEMLNAGTLSERIKADHDRLPELAKSAAHLLKHLHKIVVPEGQMQKASRLLHNNIDKLAGDFTPDEISRMHTLYDSIHEGNNFVHNDYHPKNIMESNGELMLIDLGDAGIGNPIIDLIHCCFVFKFIGASQRTSDDDMSILGLTYRDLQTFWNVLIETYCGDEYKAWRLQDKLEPYAVLMYLITALSHPAFPKEYRKIYADRIRNEVLSRYDELVKYNWEI